MFLPMSWMSPLTVAITIGRPAPPVARSPRAAIAAFPGCKLIEDYEGRDYPTPLDTSDQDLVWVGRVRDDLTSDRGLTLWCCGDQVRKGAASNAVQILQLLAKGQ